MEPKARKLAVSVEVRALSGSLLGSFELQPSSSVAEVKERLNLGVPGRYDLAQGAALLAEHTELRELSGELSGEGCVELCLVWRRRGFAYLADLGSLTLWDLESQEVVHRLSCSTCARSPVAILADWETQRVLCCLEDGTLYLWGPTDGETPHLLRIMQEDGVERPGVSGKDAVQVDWARGHVLVGTMGGRVLLWDLNAGRQLQVLKGHRSCVDVVRARWPEALSASRDKSVRIWQLQTGTCSIFKHTSSVCCLLVNWELRMAMSAGLMEGLRLWSLDSRQSVEVPLSKRDLGRIICCDVSWEREKAITGSGAGFLAMWDVKLLKVLWLHGGHGVDLSAVSLEPAAARCLSAGVHYVCIWDDAGALQCRIPGTFDEASMVLDWRTLRLLCASDVLRLYDLPQGEAEAEVTAWGAKSASAIGAMVVEWCDAVYL